MEGSEVIKDDVDDNSEYYDWVMIPHCNPEEKKNGITFKGDTAEYLRARDIIFEFFQQERSDIDYKQQEVANLGYC